MALAAVLGSLVVWIANKRNTSRLIASGEVLVTAHCANCHAIGRSGASLHPLAPPFRILFKRYPAESLVESLGEGLTSGHPDMPTFEFSPNEVDAIMAYLVSIQEPGT